MFKQMMRALCMLAVTSQLSAQELSKYTQEALDKELAAASSARLAVRVPMRDGVILATDIYLPKVQKPPYPVILWRTPYNEHRLRGMTLRYAIGAVRRGYAFILQNERGRYFSGGTYEILGRPQTDGYDTLSWIAKQDWSTGKVGTLGCSSSAEWQLALAAQRHPAHAAMVPMSAGAGIGKVGRFTEQGNWYTGGVPRSLFFVWLYGIDNPLRAQLPDIGDETLRARIESYNGVVFAVAGSAQAMTTVSSTNGPDTGPLAGQTVLYDFESGTPAGLTGNFAIVQGSVSGQYAAPLGDTTHYLTVPFDSSVGSATLVLASPLTSLSLYWGSIDAYNTISFADAGGNSLGSFTGAQVPPAPADGSQGNALNNRRVNFDFGGSNAASVTFTSTNKAFETDNIAGAVPEPASWAMLITDMGMVGAAARRRRSSGITVAA